MNDIINKLKKENEQLKNILDEKIDIALFKDDELSLLKKELNYLKNKPIHIKKTSNIKIQTDNYLDVFLNNTFDKNNNNNNKFYDIDNKIIDIKEKYEIKIKEISNELININKENFKIKNKYKGIDSLINKYEKNEIKLNEKNDCLKLQIESLKKENTQYVNIIQKDQYTSIKTLKTNLNELKNENNKNMIRIDFINSENDELQNKLIIITNNAKLLKEELIHQINLNEEFKKRFNQINLLNDKIKNLKNDYFKIKNENSNNLIIKNKYENDLIKIKRDMNSLIKENEETKIHLNRAIEDINYYRNLLNK